MNRGFTLLELLITIAVISILTAILFAISAEEERNIALRQSAFQLAQDFREMQNQAMGAQNYQCKAAETKTFGVYFGQTDGNWNNYYYLFADCDSDKLYTVGTDVILRQTNLKSIIKVSAISIPAPATSLQVTFTPPDPITSINTAITSVQTIVTLARKDAAKTISVRVNSVGLIQIE
jgi:prepilin-type N-terminal cleavage/methylation domain-containing protein